MSSLIAASMRNDNSMSENIQDPRVGGVRFHAGRSPQSRNLSM